MIKRLGWDPVKELNNLRDNMNRILEEGLASVSGSNPAIDMYETEDTVIIKTGPITGVKAEDIEVAITGDVLTIKGETRDTAAPEQESTYLRKERRFGSFTRSVTIPREIKAEETVASFKDGILTITIPKADRARPQVINIESTDS